jgi:hypothetical protein
MITNLTSMPKALHLPKPKIFPGGGIQTRAHSETESETKRSEIKKHCAIALRRSLATVIASM